MSDPLYPYKPPVFDWNKIVSTVVAFLLTSLLMGGTGLLGWIAKTQIDHIKILTRMEVKQDADRRAQDKLVEIYAQDIVELREKIDGLERLVKVPAADDDDEPPAHLSKKDYGDILKGHISRVRENEMEQRQALPDLMEKK